MPDRVPAHAPRDRQLTARQYALLTELEGLFLTRGFVRFTLDDLAAETHCSKSTLYALAPSKEQLAVRIVTRFFKGAAEMLEQRIAGLTDAREIIGEYLAGISEYLSRASDEFMRDINDFAPARAAYELNGRAAAARIRAFISQGVTEGVFREVHATLIAEMAGVLIESIQTGLLASRTGVSDAEAFTALSELLLHGMAPARSEGG